MTTLAWGARVSDPFRVKVRDIGHQFGLDPSDLMACIAFESGGTFSPSIRNGAGSGAVGLIQFMPQTAAALGTSTDSLAKMSAEAQLEFVRAYFKPNKGRLANLGDIYMAILWPGGIGKPDSYVLFDRADPDHPARYVQNVGLDFNRDGEVTRAEACARILAQRTLGMQPGNVWTGS
jgi:hypothetical protein